MHNFVRNLITEWRRLGLPFAGETFIAAVSGGADSISLLLALHDLQKRKKFNLRIVVAHFNHDLRGVESQKDEDFVKHLTGELGFELALGRGKIPGEGNLEQNARNARYEFLTSTTENLHAYGVLIAHTMNDQAETFLINLIRGSGAQGLSGMKAVRSLKSQVSSLKPENNDLGLETLDFGPWTLDLKPLLIRPLLTWAKRIDTENFCRENETEYLYDTMNEDLAFKRVRIRKVLLPMLADFNPNIVETLARTAELMRHLSEPPASAGGFVSEPPASAGGLMPGNPDQPDELKLKDLKTLPKPDLYLTLRQWLEQKRGNLRSLELKHIEAIERLILSTKSGRTVELPGGETVVKQDAKLIFRNIKVDK
ncbi:MAG: tRNA lysidine(34) synthetase TilS [Pyrinomonadaceae bacterium]